VYHQEGTTLGTDASNRKNRLMTENKVKFVKKWSAFLQERHCPRQTPLWLAARRKAYPRVLWVDNIVPEVDRDSGSIRATWMLRILQNHGYAVAFQPRLERQAASDRKYGQQLRYYGIEVLPATMPSTWQLKDPLGECRYDLFIISRPDNYQWAWPTLNQACPDVPMVYDTVDLHFLREARVALMKSTHPGLLQVALPPSRPDCTVCAI
jgi:hypothetical protein